MTQHLLFDNQQTNNAAHNGLIYQLPAWFSLPKSSFWIKKDLERNPFQSVIIRRGDRVMDCGAYIGTFAVSALEQGAGVVYCYEAAPKNASRLRENLSRYGERAIVIEKAISGSNGSACLRLSGFDGANSIAEPRDTRKRKSIHVSTVALGEQLRMIRPQVLKVDIEGAEYEAFESVSHDDLASVTSLFIEFHPIAERDMRIDCIRAKVRDAGLIEISTRRRAYTANRAISEVA